MSDTNFGFDAGLYAAQRWRALRRWVLLLVALGALLEFGGLPHLRVTYLEQGGQVRVGNYWSVTGARRVVAGEFAQGCPLFVLIPLDQSLVSYAAAALKGN